MNYYPNNLNFLSVKKAISKVVQKNSKQDKHINTFTRQSKPLKHDNKSIGVQNQ